MSNATSVDVAGYLRIIPDFPKPGILFRDISPLLAAPEAFRFVIHEMAQRLSRAGIDALVGIESRGFIFAAPLAIELGVPLVMVRKPGKLPGSTESIQYGLEYGSDSLHLQSGAVRRGSSVVVVDDVLATGGTAVAVRSLIEQVGARVLSCVFLAELRGLGGREKLGSCDVQVVVEL
ncbi:MAG: adenine phosphoribosyltransferase [Pseudomonadota bacterium]|jgi:adenine phosphoribosyltransferase